MIKSSKTGDVSTKVDLLVSKVSCPELDPQKKNIPVEKTKSLSRKKSAEDKRHNPALPPERKASGGISYGGLSEEASILSPSALLAHRVEREIDADAEIEAVQALAERLEVFNVSSEQIQRVVAHFSPAERPYVVQILWASRQNWDLHELCNRLDESVAHLPEWGTVVYRKNSSAAKALGYLLHKRRLNSAPRLQTVALEELEWHRSNQCSSAYRNLVLVDELSTDPLTAKQVEELSAAEQIVNIDLGGFERGPNFVDFAISEERVVGKIASLIPVLRERAVSEKSDDVLRAARALLSGPQENNRAMLVLKDQIDLAKAGNDSQSFLERQDEPIQGQHILSFAQSKFPDEPELRALALRLLTETYRYLTPKELVVCLRKAVTKLEHYLRSLGKTLEDVLVVPDLNYANGSNHLLTFFLQQTGIFKPEQFATQMEVRRNLQKGLYHNKVLVQVDDLLGSGDQAVSTFNTDPEIRRESFAATICLRLFSFESGEKHVATSAYSRGVETIAAEEGLLAVNDERHPFAASLSPDQMKMLSRLVGHAHKGEGDCLSFFYMNPDNSPELVRDFANEVLKIPVFLPAEKTT